MNDSGFESSGIRQLLIKTTGINVLSIENEEENLPIPTDAMFLIVFTTQNYPEKQFHMTISLLELNRLCESDLARFKEHFEKFASSQTMPG